MTVAAEVESERAALADSLTATGPLAPTACRAWTAFDLAAHLVSEERAGGVVTSVARSLVVRGIRVTDPKGIARSVHRERRHGFEALVERLRQQIPRLLLRQSIAPLTLFEYWTHHDDLAVPNGLDHDAAPHLYHAIPPLVRYQSKHLPADVRLIIRTSGGPQEWAFGPKGAAQVAVCGPLADLVRWLAGRDPITPLAMTGPNGALQAVRVFAGRV